MPFVLPSDPVSGQIAPVTWGDAVRDTLNYLANKPSCRCTASGTVSHATSGQYQAVAFDTEDWDNDGIHSTSVNTSRFTAATAGKYWVYGNVRFAANATGVRIVGIRKNLTGTNSPTHGTVKRANLTADSVDIMVGTMVALAAGDWVEIVAWQNSGAALNMENTGGALHGGITWQHL
jgi:hypothetical protein